MHADAAGIQIGGAEECLVRADLGVEAERARPDEAILLGLRVAHRRAQHVHPQAHLRQGWSASCSRYLSPRFDRRQRPLVQPFRHPLTLQSAGIAADVARTGIPINVPFPAVQCQSFSIEIDRLPGENARTVICEPIRHEGSIVAVTQSSPPQPPSHSSFLFSCFHVL